MKNAEVGALKPIESQGVDLSQFEGSRVKIETVEVLAVPSKYSRNGNGEAEVLRVQSVPLATIQDKEGNDVPIPASELFNLTRDENGVLGWPEGARGKLAKFMKKLSVEHPKELPGKQAVVRIHTKQGSDGIEREFLGFITD